jgi:hypothetical protein
MVTKIHLKQIALNDESDPNRRQILTLELKILEHQKEIENIRLKLKQLRK